MPGFDQSGPSGQGPLTGRGIGKCNGAANNGFGYGRGAGRGYRCVNARRGGSGYGYRGRGPSPFFSSDPGSQEERLAFEQQSLRERQAWLQAELERTNSMLETRTNIDRGSDHTKAD